MAVLGPRRLYLGIYAQRYNAAGVAQGTEFRVNTVTTFGQSAPAVAMDADGGRDLHVASDGQDGLGYGIYTKSFTAGGRNPSASAGPRRCRGGAGSTRTVVAGDVPAPILGADVTISAAGVLVLTGATLRIEARPDGAAETLTLTDATLAAANTAGITAAWDAGDGRADPVGHGQRRGL